jgi:branched-chain amino acid transport system ATP-binding protein/urea transport system ATP-binding protein
MTLLRTENLTKRFEGLLANDGIDFSMAPGSLRAVIGPNGAGKTTFISMISGHLPATAGSITFKGEPVTGLDVAARARLGIARKFQTPQLFDNLSVFDNLELAQLARRRSAAARTERIEEVLDLIRLGDQTALPAKALSHGQRQWLEIGLLLANDAELLLLDEPTAGMTAEETKATGDLVRRLVDQLGLAAIIIEHDINFIRALQAPVTVLHLGKVLLEGSYDDVAANQEVRDVYLGNA